jgi:predicted PurR-regulated permease PerM
MEKSDRWLALSLRIALLGLFVWMIEGLLIPVALGGLFAIILNPLHRRLSRRLGRRASWSPLFITMGAILLGVLPIGLVSVKAVSSMNRFLARDWGETFGAIRGFLSDKVAGYTHFLQMGDESGPERIGAAVENLVREVGTTIAAAAGNFAMALPGQLLDLFLFLVSLYYFLRDGRTLAKWLHGQSPFSPESTDELFASIHDTVNGAVLGLMATALVQGGLTILALSVAGVPGAFVFGLIATFLALIPMVGTTPITIGAAIYLVATGRTGAAIGMGIAAAVIGISDNVVRPLVQSSQSKMHPLLVLLSLFGGIEVFGAFGVFVGPVVAAMAIWTVDTYAHLRSEQRRREAPLSVP